MSNENENNEEAITPVFFEKLLIKFLFSDIAIREKTIPFLVPEIFEDQKNLQLIKSILEMNTKYNKFPTVPEMRLVLENEGVYNRLVEVMNMDVSVYQDEFLLSEIEEFMRSKLIHNINIDIAMGLNDGKFDDLQKYPDLLREAISFSFDTKVGLDFLDDEDRLYDYLHNKDKVIPTNIEQLNVLIDGGFHEKSLTLLLAQVNLGKSLIMCSMATDCILKNKNVLYVTLEMSEEKVSERIMSNMFDIELDDLRLLPRNKFHEKFEKIKKEVNKKIVIKEYPTASINTNHIRNLIKELKVVKHFEPDIVFIDYLGIMLPSHRNKVDNTYIEVKRISEELRALAVELGLPIVSAIQSNRAGFSSPEIDMTNISDSIGIAATADIIIAVTQSDELKALGKYRWVIIKNRYGLNNMSVSVCVNYYKMRVYEDKDSIPEVKIITKNTPLSETERKKNVDSVVDDVKNILNKDTNDKFKKMISFT